MTDKLWLFLKALSPINVRPDGKVNVPVKLHSLNAASPIIVTELSIFYVPVNPEQPLNILS